MAQPSESAELERENARLRSRVEALEARLEEQEQSVRYLLQLLIEWLDKDGRKAA